MSFVKRVLGQMATCKGTFRHIQETNHTSVSSVKRVLGQEPTCKVTFEGDKQQDSRIYIAMMSMKAYLPPAHGPSRIVHSYFYFNTA